MKSIQFVHLHIVYVYLLRTIRRVAFFVVKSSLLLHINHQMCNYINNHQIYKRCHSKILPLVVRLLRLILLTNLILTRDTVVHIPRYIKHVQSLLPLESHLQVNFYFMQSHIHHIVHFHMILRYGSCFSMFTLQGICYRMYAAGHGKM